MKILIHDFNQQDFSALNINCDKDTVIISNNGTIRNCIGCFGCWVKTPGICVLKDSYNNMGELLSKCSELVIISKCVYGCYSPFVKNVWDRCISYLLPYFVHKNGETHHPKRYKNIFALSVHFYGADISDEEQKTAKALVEANGTNFHPSKNNTYFYKNFKEIGGLI